MFSKLLFFVASLFLFNSPQAFSAEKNTSPSEKCRKAVSDVSVLETPVTGLLGEYNMSVRLQNALQIAGIVYIGDLVTKTEKELLKIPGFGRRTLNEVKELLSEKGLQLGMSVDWPSDREQVEKRVKKISSMNPVYNTSDDLMELVTNLDMSPRLLDKLQQAGIVYIEELVTKTKEELQEMGFRGKALNDLEEKLLKKDLHLSNRKQIEQLVKKSNLKVKLTPLFAYPIEVLAKYFPSSYKWFLRFRPKITKTSITKTIKILKNNGIHYVGDLVTKTEAELLKIPGFGKETLLVVKRVLAWPLHLGMNLDWPSDREKVKVLVQTLNSKNLGQPFMNPSLIVSVERLEFFTRVRKRLRISGIVYIGDLVTKTEEELFKIQGFGRKSMNEVKELLPEIDLELGMEVDWPSDRKQVEQLFKILNPTVELNPIFTYPIEFLAVLAPPSVNKNPIIIKRIKTLKNNGIHYIGDLVSKGYLELSEIIHKKLIGGDYSMIYFKEIKACLSKTDLHLGMNIDWPSDRDQVEALVRELRSMDQAKK